MTAPPSLTRGTKFWIGKQQKQEYLIYFCPAWAKQLFSLCFNEKISYNLLLNYSTSFGSFLKIFATVQNPL